MSLPEAYFEIIEEKNCPLYGTGDRFELSGKALILDDQEQKTFISTAVIKMPNDKSICRTLMNDLTSVIIKYESMSSVHRCVINCSGCSGVIKLEFTREMARTDWKDKKKPVATANRFDNIGAIAGMLYIFPIFQTLDQQDIKNILPLLKIKKFAKGSTILKKGDPGANLYIIVSGKAEVIVNGDANIGTMERGDVFGEISLLTGTPVGATVKAVDFVTALIIYGKDFRKVLTKFPSLQMYFARLLAERLTRTHVAQDDEFASGLSGNLAEMPSSELFQTLNLNHKTGMLTLTLPAGEAKAVFNEGKLTGAEYKNMKGQEAFFEILKEKKGRFRFVQGLSSEETKAVELGDFMWMLMEGIRRVDENDEN